jgi:hypothetical protein
MKRLGVFALLLLAAGAASAVAAGKHSAAPSAARCGGETWRLKTFSDVQRKAVALVPKSTTIGDILQRPYPRPVPRKRRTPFQRQNWEVVAQVTSFRLEDAGLRLILFDQRAATGGAYVNAVIPAPSCLSKHSRARTAMNSAWNTFVTKCTRPTREWQSLGAVVYVSGVGLWTERRGERGAAPNGAELYPVTSLRIVVGCH